MKQTKKIIAFQQKENGNLVKIVEEKDYNKKNIKIKEKNKKKNKINNKQKTNISAFM